MLVLRREYFVRGGTEVRGVQFVSADLMNFRITALPIARRIADGARDWKKINPATAQGRGAFGADDHAVGKFFVKGAVERRTPVASEIGELRCVPNPFALVIQGDPGRHGRPEALPETDRHDGPGRNDQSLQASSLR